MEKNPKIYVIKENRNEIFYYKIGFTTRSAENRIKEMSTGNPLGQEAYSVILIVDLNCSIPITKKIESSVQWHFSDKKTFGEWFLLDEYDIAKIPNLVLGIQKNYKQFYA